MVVIDDDICAHEPKEPVFPYMLITEKQNDYMHSFQRVFRFLGYARENLDSYLAKDGIVLEGGYIRNTGDRSEQADASPLEKMCIRDRVRPALHGNRRERFPPADQQQAGSKNRR